MRWLQCLCVVVVLSLSNARSATATDIDVITTDDYVFDVEVLMALGVSGLYNVDDFKRLDQALGQGLTADETASRQHVTARLPAVQAELAKAFKGNLIVDTLDLKALPAIVFGRGAAVYYGTDVEQAIQLWNHYAATAR